jgi:integrase
VVSFESETEAFDFAAAARGEVTGHTIATAIELYVADCQRRGLKSVKTIGFRLHGLLGAAGDRPLRSLTVTVARDLFARRSGATSGDTQHGELAAARQFVAFCRSEGWMVGDPFAELSPTKPKSRARRKQQHRIDEARRFIDCAAGAGEEGVAAAMALLMDLRASEIIGRRVRDVDNRGTILVIEEAKSDAGERRLGIPEELRAPIAQLCANRKADDLLFPGRTRRWVDYHVRRICGMAQVPVIGPHGLRRTHSSISVGEVSVEHVALAMGHASATVTRRHYLAPGAEQTGRARAALRVLKGGVP